ncbi:MAG: 4Fe-4S binding protein [Candidatus Omnitrophota bacterium]
MKRIIILLIIVAAIVSIHLVHTSKIITPETLPSSGGFTLKEVKLVFPEAAELVPARGNGWSQILDEKGNSIGAAVTTRRYSDHITGHGGPTPLLIGVGREGNITGVCLLESDESPDFVEKIASSDLLKSWDGIHWHEAIETEVDAVTGATMTSASVIKSLRYRLSGVKGEALTSRIRFTYSDLVAVILAGIALFICLRPVKYRLQIRTVLLIASVVYLGFARCQFLSIELLAGWIKWGLFLKTSLGLGVIALLAVLIPLFTGKPMYCYFLCPFGGAQELIYRISPWHKKISHSLARVLMHIRTTLLLAAALALLFDVYVNLTSFEPFTIFLIWPVNKTVAVIAGISLVLSFFVARPWCHFCCPTGAFLDLFRRK